MKKRALTFNVLTLFLGILLFASFVSAEKCGYFFYGEGCSHCARVEPFLKEVIKNNPNLNITYFEVYSNRDNLPILEQYFDAYNIELNKRGVPALFISDKAFIGDTPILENLANVLLENDELACPNLEENNKSKISGPSSPKEKLKSLSWVTIISAAVVDSINPCAIAVIIILLGALLSSGNKKKILRSGLAFTVSVYIMYLLFGIGLFSAIQISGLSYYLYKMIGIIAIVIGIFNIKDYVKYGSFGFVMEIPRKWRPTLKKMLSSVTSPVGAFFLGFAVTFFELPCTGGPYLFVLGLLSERTTQLSAIPILLVYNIFFVLPLIVITLLLNYGYTNVEKASKWKDDNIRLLHLIAGIVMIVLGLLVTFGLV